MQKKLRMFLRDEVGYYYPISEYDMICFEVDDEVDKQIDNIGKDNVDDLNLENYSEIVDKIIKDNNLVVYGYNIEQAITAQIMKRK